MPRAGYHMIIHHTHRLHKRIDYSRADKVEPAAFQILADLIGKRGVRGHFGLFL